MQLEEYPTFSPLHLIRVKSEARYAPFDGTEPLGRSHALASTYAISGEEPFGVVSLGWSEEGMRLQVEYDRPFKEGKGDRIEFWIDTRDTQDSGFATRFCHHFIAYPRGKELAAEEVSQFRTEDAHIPCDPQLLSLVRRAPNVMELAIPKEALVGYEPSEFSRIGFNYRLHKEEKVQQHLSLDHRHISAEHYPSLWASVSLI